MSAGPEPTKCACGQQSVDEAVENFLEGRAPGLALPDRVAEAAQAEVKGLRTRDVVVDHYTALKNEPSLAT